MESRLHKLVARIKDLEKELTLEIQKTEKEYYYKIYGKKVAFEEWIKHDQKALVQKFIPFIRESTWPVILSAPIVWAVLLPTLLLDFGLALYQAVCFPLFNIPRVIRDDYIVLDRHMLPYLNIIEKINCEYCAYFNGLIAYAQEIGARTEQYWCPIKHARKLTLLHNRYATFFEYGDGTGYRDRIESVRRQFEDLDREAKND
jgi:hypothetical protein